MASDLTTRIVRAVQASPSGALASRHGLKAGRAQILTPEQLDHLLHHVQATSLHVLRDYAILIFSFKAALRVGEIAGLNWRDVMDAAGKVGRGRLNPVTNEVEYFFEVPPGIAKKGSGRTLPMHPALKVTLEHLKMAASAMGRDRPYDPIIRGVRTERISANSLAVYVRSIYVRAGLRGSSHSGRRTALTQLAQTANQQGCSLFDVQDFAGHRDITTTEAYVEASPYAGRMVRSL